MLTDFKIDTKRHLEIAVSRLMKVTPDGERSRVAMPILFPSGSSSAVEVTFNDGKCFVSDYGLGQMEAEMNGAGTFYSPAARKAASRFDVGFDGLSMFKTWAPIDRIESALIGVANASVFAASAAIFKAIEEKERQKNEELFDRVRHVFGASSVSKSVEVIGRDATWDAHNVVMLKTGKKAIFEFVSENQNSIASKFMMFSDLANVSNRDKTFTLTSVVSSIERIGKKGSMLQDVSEILELAANDDKYRQRAMAA